VNSSSVLFIVGTTPFLVAPRSNHEPTGSKGPVPGVVTVTTAAGVVPPVRAVVTTVIVGTLVEASRPPKVITTAAPGRGPPVHVTWPAPMVETPSSAVCTAAALAL
jgi:hypothetical protein